MTTSNDITVIGNLTATEPTTAGYATAYPCAAGQTGFHIDAAGRLQLCMMERRWSYDLARGSFRQGWEEALPRILGRPAAPNDPCRQCPDWRKATRRCRSGPDCLR